MISAAFLLETALYLIFAVPVVVISIRRFKIPLAYLCFGIFVFVVLRVFFEIPNPSVFVLRARSVADKNFFRNLLFVLSGALSSYFLFTVLKFFSDDSLSTDDVLFGVFTALYCQFYLNLVAVILSACIGVLYYILLAVLQKFKKKDGIFRPVFSVRFVPFIAAGAVLTRILL